MSSSTFAFSVAAALEMEIDLKEEQKTEALETLGDTLNFIEIWLKLLDHNYKVICGIYDKAMK